MVAQSVVSPSADPWVVSLILARSYTLVEFAHEIIPGHSPPSAVSKIVVSYKRNYVHKVLVIRSVKLAQEKVWLGELTISR